nr:hypothetical protein [Brevundimonas diminuta]
MVMTVAEASAFDMLETLTDAGRIGRFTRQRFGEMARQVSEGAAFTLRDGEGRLIAVAGLWPEADHAEAWLAVGPAFRANLRGAMRQLGALLTGVAEGSGTQEVRLYVAKAKGAERVAGGRLAAWSGFIRSGEEATPLGPVEVYRRSFGGPRHGQ